MKPWHLHSKEERDCVLARLDSYRSVFYAAATLLREAAPWPDEALVVECVVDQEIGEILDMASAYGSRFVVVRWQLNGDHVQHVKDLAALTPAAAEFLAAMGGGE